MLVDARQHFVAARKDRESILPRLLWRPPHIEKQSEIRAHIRQRIGGNGHAAVRIRIAVQDLVPPNLPYLQPVRIAHRHDYNASPRMRRGWAAAGEVPSRITARRKGPRRSSR